VFPVRYENHIYVCEASRIPHFVDNGLTDGGNVVRLKSRTRSTPQEDPQYSVVLKVKSSPAS
jgi:hypothetical protein